MTCADRSVASAVLVVAVHMYLSRFVALALASSLGTTAACSSQRSRTVAYAVGGAAIAGGTALAVGSNMQEDEEDDVPFDELGVGLGLGLAVAGAIVVGTTLALSPDPEPPPAKAASLDDQLRAIAASR